MHYLIDKKIEKLLGSLLLLNLHLLQLNCLDDIIYLLIKIISKEDKKKD